MCGTMTGIKRKAIAIIDIAISSLVLLAVIL
jgi:hypothetical protein